MKKVIVISVIIVVILAGFFFAGKSFVTDKREHYVWIIPMIDWERSTTGTATPIEFLGNYIFNVTVGGDNASAETSARLRNDLKRFGNGGIFFDNSELRGDVACTLAYRDVKISGGKMTIKRHDGKVLTVNPGRNENLFRRVLYPIEPTEENNWSGWPK